MKIERLLLALAVFSLVVMPAALRAHGGHGHVMGKVKEVKADRLQVETSDGKAVEVQLTAKTRYLRDKGAAKVSDLTPGMRVVVDTEEVKGQMVAVEVKLGVVDKPAAAPATSKTGKN
jgi:hypothetical protein